MQSQDILPLETRNLQSEVMNARIAGAIGTLGSWWAELENVRRWQAGSPDDWPDGIITVGQGGLLRLVFGDLTGWRPFISVRGVDPARALGCRMRYKFTDRPIYDGVPINYDSTLGRHYGVGPVCDGTLAQAGANCAIELTGNAAEGTDWRFEQAVFGYVQLGGDS
ncbi:MAG: hypothetical protein NWS68_01130 [Erythrobacter sp.]|nr:hypothetical protein [Erythrobacter sp.]